ncbi:heat shock 70 kDa protein [Fimicolochytrium jonesii]|uniref:heat shock 70 kDa protein n=1 Tax=Fimicolochytrium jonesii TaxID=1396493 RepID=UPI0022FE1A0F|nr:heat shock 70 kDa protein [Fimicolochytrium jonesii]KAI8818468.1 heat shock 70 kDa protein [Fimicolochytrium jonesii]
MSRCLLVSRPALVRASGIRALSSRSAPSCACYSSRRLIDTPIGIDLGTTNSCVAVMDGKNPRVVPNDLGSLTTPSVVAFRKDTVLVGSPAKRQAATTPENTFASIKRLLGRKFSDLEVHEHMKNVLYKVTTDGRRFSPAQILAFVLMDLKRTSERALGDEVKSAVISVPAQFNCAQREAVRNAAHIAGLEVKGLLNETGAAALAYSESEHLRGDIAIYGLGGGTCGISVLNLTGGTFEVLSTNGDTHLGGDDFVTAIVNHLLREFGQKEGVDLSKDRMALQRIRDASEQAMIELSASTRTEIHLPYLAAYTTGPKHMHEVLKRATFEELTKPLIERTLDRCREAMKDSRIAAKDLHAVLLVGAMTRVPKVQQMVKDLFGRDPIRAPNIEGAVAIGAALHGGVLSGAVDQIDLKDVTPLSLKIGIPGGDATRLIIPRNTRIPAKKSHCFSTTYDNQAHISINVYQDQGEHVLPRHMKAHSKMTLVDIQPASEGMPQIAVTFDINADGIITISARDLATGRKQPVTITTASGLSDAEIQEMIGEGERYAESDQRRREAIEAMNYGKSIVNDTQQAFEEYRDHLSEEDLGKIQAEIHGVEELLERAAKGVGITTEEIKEKYSELQRASLGVFELMYRKRSGKQGSNDGSSGGGS